MSTWPELYFLRHGQTEWNAEGRVQGSLDSRLSDLGRQQAMMQRDILSTLDLSGFTGWTSTQGRARGTADIALAGLVEEIRPDPRLTEIALGDWEGHLRAEIELPFPADESDESGIHVFDTAPRGEGFEALHARCRSLLEDLTGPSVLVTHGVTSRMMRLIVLGLDMTELVSLPGGQGVIYHLKDGTHRRLG